MFDSRQQAEGFETAATPYSRMSGTAQDFASDVKNGVLQGITFLRSLRRRLPLIVAKSSLIQRAPLKEASQDDPRSQVAAGLLQKVHPDLANSYKQVLRDLKDVTRLSYRGTANELREILRELLERLAPDDEVVLQTWFTPTDGPDSKKRKGPTHQQRARYILENKRKGSRVQEVAEKSLSVVEQGLSELVRAMYSRTSVASHTAQDLEEIKKQLNHFDALIHDLCGD